MPSSAFRMVNQIHQDATNCREVEGWGCSAMFTRYGGNVMLCTIIPHNQAGMPLFDDSFDLQEPAPGFLEALAKAFGLSPIEEVSERAN